MFAAPVPRALQSHCRAPFRVLNDVSSYPHCVALLMTMSIKDGWFSETEALWPGQKFSLEVIVRFLRVWILGHTSVQQ